MLTFSGSLRIFLAVEPCDMRKSFNGLYAMTEGTLQSDPKSGAIFVFTNKRRNRIKILYFDGTGLWVMTKRLETGTFSWPKSAEAGRARLSLTPEAFAMLTDGIDLRDGCRRGWYERD
jgi:transposase